MKIYPNTTDKLKGKLCVAFTAVNAITGTVINRSFLPNVFTNDYVTCSDLQKSFFGSNKSHHPSYKNCNILYMYQFNAR